MSARKCTDKDGSIETRFKLLVLDIDGTLLNREGTLSAEDKKALAIVAASGIKVSLSSGRSVLACLPIIDQLSLDGCHTSFDGALVSNPKLNHEVYVDPISGLLVEQIIDFIHSSDINLELYSDKRLFIEKETWAADVRRQVFSIQPVIGDFAKIEREERIIKGTIVARSPEEKAKAEHLFRHFESRLSFSRNKTPAFPGVDFVNILAPGVSKGKALEALASFMGISMAEVMAIGDGSNDASLFSRVGLAVAMGDASDELKDMAHHVTLDADHSGVAEAVSRILLAR